MAEDLSSSYEKNPYVELFGQCLEIKKIEEGKIIPAGGTSIFSNEIDLGFVGDFGFSDPLFEEASANVFGLQTEKLRRWLDENKLDIDPKLVATLESFQRSYQSRYKTGENHSDRERFYTTSEGPPSASQIFATNVQECAEIAALAQLFLQKEGVDSSYIGGDVLWNSEAEFSDKHSFILIRSNRGQLIYDPTNPTQTKAGFLPSIYLLNSDFDGEIKKGQKRFVKARNILTKTEVLFGVNDGTNVSEDDMV